MEIVIQKKPKIKKEIVKEMVKEVVIVKPPPKIQWF